MTLLEWIELSLGLMVLTLFVWGLLRFTLPPNPDLFAWTTKKKD